MTRERALEIIDAYGADAARWPADERAAVLALAGRDEAVRAALATAQQMDALLGSWAMDVPERSFDADALLPAARAVPSGGAVRGGVMRWVTGGALAAALAVALVVSPDGGGGETRVTMVEIDTALPGSAGDAAELDESFAMFFTPTADEEDVI